MLKTQGVRLRVALAALVLFVAPGDFAHSADEVRSDRDHARVLKHVLPDRADLAWASIPWEATLWDAVIEAHEAKKPILLWAMNGHALACT